MGIALALQLFDIDDMHAYVIDNERIQELHGYGFWRIESDLLYDLWLKRRRKIDDDKLFIGRNVRVIAGDRDVVRTVENAVRIKGQRTAQEIISRIAVEQRRGIDEDEALEFIRDVEVRIKRMDRA